MTAAETTTMHSALINYPKQAAFGRTLPKNKIYDHSGVNSRLKDLFVAQVEQIVWEYKLAPETVNLPSKPAVPEVQVFSILMKTAELSMDVLKCIDGAVQFPIIFELHYEGRTKVTAAHKRLNEANASKCVISDYFSTAWMPSDSVRGDMPVVLDLGGLYEALLQRLIPLDPRPHESVVELISRQASVKEKQLEIEKIANSLTKEKQFNRKVEINDTLRKINNELKELCR